MARAVLRSSQFGAAGSARLADATKLLERGRWNGAIYMSGYGVECHLKAEVAAGLAGLGGWLRQRDTPLFDALWKHELVAIAELLAYPVTLIQPIKTFASEWSTDLRYNARPGARSEAESLVGLAQGICKQIRLRLL